MKVLEILKKQNKFFLYQDVNHILNMDLPYDRKYNPDRIIKLNELVKPYKKGIDIGCNVGLNCFEINKEMHGIDNCHQSILLAETINVILKDNCIFENISASDFVDKKYEKLDDIQSYDFCLFLSTWHWVAHYEGIDEAKRVLYKLSENIPVMIFETAQGKAQFETSPIQEVHFNNVNEVYDFLIKNTVYTDIKDCGITDSQWHNRNTFLCKR